MYLLFDLEFLANFSCRNSPTRTGGQASTRVRSACSRQTMSSSTAKRQHHPLRRTYHRSLLGRTPRAITVLGQRPLPAYMVCLFSSFTFLSTGLVPVNAKATRALFLHFLPPRLYFHLYSLSLPFDVEIHIWVTPVGPTLSPSRASARKKETPPAKSLNSNKQKKKAKKTPPSRNKKSTKQHQHLFCCCPQLKPAPLSASNFARLDGRLKLPVALRDLCHFLSLPWSLCRRRWRSPALFCPPNTFPEAPLRYPATSNTVLPRHNLDTR